MRLARNWTEAMNSHAVAEAMLRSKSLARRRLRLIQAKKRSTTQRLGWTAKPFWPGLALTISMAMQVARTPNGWMSPDLEDLTLLISHQDQVTQLPDNATLLASSEFCPIASYCIGDQVLCFQGHPEFVHDYSRALLDLRQQHIGEPAYSKGVDSLQHDHQGHTVAEWMMRFVAHGRAGLAE